jgi:hypothetical protein
MQHLHTLAKATGVEALLQQEEVSCVHDNIAAAALAAGTTLAAFIRPMPPATST